MDAVELNSLKGVAPETSILYTEAMVDYGFICLFSVACPIGPFIYLLISTFEIRFLIT